MHQVYGYLCEGCCPARAPGYLNDEIVHGRNYIMVQAGMPMIVKGVEPVVATRRGFSPASGRERHAPTFRAHKAPVDHRPVKLVRNWQISDRSGADLRPRQHLRRFGVSEPRTRSRLPDPIPPSRRNRQFNTEIAEKKAAPHRPGDVALRGEHATKVARSLRPRVRILLFSVISSSSVISVLKSQRSRGTGPARRRTQVPLHRTSARPHRKPPCLNARHPASAR